MYLIDVNNSAYVKGKTNKSRCNVLIKTIATILIFINSLSIRVNMGYNIRKIRNLLLKLKSNLGLHHVLLTTPKIYAEKLTLTVVEMQQLPDIEKTN